MKIKCTFHIAIAFILIQLTDEFSIAFAYGICEKNPYVRILYVTFAILSLLTMIYLYTKYIATVYKGNIIKNLIMDCQSYTKYRPNETTGGIFVSWRRKEELPTGA